MSPQEPYESGSTSPIHVSETGQSKEDVNIGLHQEESNSTMKKTSIDSSETTCCKRKRVLSMPGSVPLIKRKISNDKSTTLNESTQVDESSTTSDQDSTSIEKVYKPFWNSYSTEVSRKLWLPTKTDYVDSDSTSSIPFVGPLMCDSWFTTERRQVVNRNSLKTSWPLSISSLQRTMVDDQANIENDDELVTNRILLKLNKHQKETLKQWFGVYRWTYNQCIQALRDKSFIPSGNEMTKRIILRERFVKSCSPVLKDKEWVKKVPFDVRDGAIIEFVQNLTTELNKGHQFTLSFKSKYDKSCSIPVLKRNWIGGTWFPRTLKKSLKGTEYVPAFLEKDSKITKSRFNKFVLCLPTQRMPPKEHTNPLSSIALDPGDRTFLTGYDPSGEIIEIGKGDSGSIMKMCYEIDRLTSKISAAKRHKNRYQLKKAAARLRQTIKNRVKDLHCKAAKYLCEAYQTIFLPKFETQNMVKKHRRKIRNKTVRSMLTFSHYAFRMHLLHKAKDYKGCKVVIVDEAYTSKTCGNCGQIHNVGSSKIFKCPHCHVVLDRDVNGARNIWIRSIQEVPVHLRGLTPVSVSI